MAKSRKSRTLWTPCTIGSLQWCLANFSYCAGCPECPKCPTFPTFCHFVLLLSYFSAFCPIFLLIWHFLSYLNCLTFRHFVLLSYFFGILRFYSSTLFAKLQNSMLNFKNLSNIYTVQCTPAPITLQRT